MKNTIFFVFCFLSTFFYAQSTPKDKVGINTKTPTEILDVNETMRVRTIPNNKATYVDGTGTSKTYTAISPVVVSDNYNVVGRTTKADLVPNNTTSDFNTSDNSTAMFVIRRFKIGDWPSASGNVGTALGVYVPNTTDPTKLVLVEGSTMSTAKWDAILSNVGFGFTKADEVKNVFNQKHLHSWQLIRKDGVWKIWGDINGMQEKSDYVDVLFIRKSNVASEERNELYNW